MEYKIEYDYYTGNSFGSEDSTGVLELEWKDLQVAKDNLKRIQEHWRYYKSKERIRDSYSQTQVVNELEIVSTVEKEQPDWYVKPEGDYKSHNHHCIILYTDNGKPWQIWCPWCGYFEGLYGAKIINAESDLEFTV